MRVSTSRHKIAPPRDYFDSLRGRLATATDTEKAQAHAEIAERYAWDIEQRRKPVDKLRLILQTRLRQMERLFVDRWGEELPNNRAGWRALVDAAHTIAGLGGEAEGHIVAWAAMWAPWLATGRAQQLAAHIAANPIKLGADTLGWRLGLTVEERVRLRITTIGAVGESKADRAAERRRKRRERERARRADKGARKPRGRPSKGKPWLAAGVSRSAWYRWDKNARPAGNTVIVEDNYAGHAISSHATPTNRGEVAKGPARREPARKRQRPPHRAAPSGTGKAKPKVKTPAKGKPVYMAVPTYPRAALLRAGFLLDLSPKRAPMWLRTA